MVALLLKPWAAFMRTLQVTPRVLADDLLVTALGTNAVARYVHAMSESRVFFTAMGARVADSKCFSFASQPLNGRFLATLNWNPNPLAAPSHAPVVMSFRDLGNHINLTASHAAPKQRHSEVPRAQHESAGRLACTYGPLLARHAQYDPTGP